MKKVLLGLSFAITTLLIIYYLLGGLRSISFEVVQSPDSRLAGRYYNGSHDSNAISDLFDEFRKLTHTNRLDSSIVIVSFNKGVDEDSVNYFIGVVIHKDSIAGYRTMQLHSKALLTVWLSGHPLVLPSAESLYLQAESKSTSLQNTLTGYSIETYYPDGRIKVEFPMED